MIACVCVCTCVCVSVCVCVLGDCLHGLFDDCIRLSSLVGGRAGDLHWFVHGDVEHRGIPEQCPSFLAVHELLGGVLPSGSLVSCQTEGTPAIRMQPR